MAETKVEATPLWKISNYRPFGIIERDPSESTYERGDDTSKIIVDVRGSYSEKKARAERIVLAVSSLEANQKRIEELEDALRHVLVCSGSPDDCDSCAEAARLCQRKETE